MRNKYLQLAFVAFSAGASIATCYAETLHNVYPYEHLGDVKAKYPNAVFKKIPAAWVTESEAFFSMEGAGFPGKLMLHFQDGRPGFRKFWSANCNANSITEENKKLCELEAQWKDEPDDRALTVDWVRWVPEKPIPIARYISKYGEPSKYDFDPNDMTPKAYWTTHALSANLSDDKATVLFIETTFTKAERRQAWLRSGTYVPPELQEPDPQPKEPPKPKAKQPM